MCSLFSPLLSPRYIHILLDGDRTLRLKVMATSTPTLILHRPRGINIIHEMDFIHTSKLVHAEQGVLDRLPSPSFLDPGGRLRGLRVGLVTTAATRTGLDSGPPATEEVSEGWETGTNDSDKRLDARPDEDGRHRPSGVCALGVFLEGEDAADTRYANTRCGGCKYGLGRAKIEPGQRTNYPKARCRSPQSSETSASATYR